MVYCGEQACMQPFHGFTVTQREAAAAATAPATLTTACDARCTAHGKISSLLLAAIAPPQLLCFGLN
jgi:hypothetical protein